MDNTVRHTIAIALILVILAGCQTRTATNTPRTAIEQMLLSGAVDAALDKLQIPGIDGRKVYLDFTNLKAYDVEYIRVATRARFSQLGASLVDAADGADYIVEVASGALGLEYKSSVVGIPPLPMPNSPIATPALPFYSSREQTGIVKLLFFIRAGDEYLATCQAFAKCDRDENHVFGIRYQSNDDVRTRWEQADASLAEHAPAVAAKE